MQRKYFLLILLMLVFIVLSVRQYVIQNSNQRNETSAFINKQIILCGRSIEEASNVFEESVKYEFANLDLPYFFDADAEHLDPEIYSHYISGEFKRIRRFYSNNQFLIAGITIYNDSSYRSFERNDNNYFNVSTLEPLPKSVKLRAFPVFLETDSTTTYIQPITNGRGELIANARFDLDISKFLLYHFGEYYIGRNSWEWAINSRGRIILQSFSEPTSVHQFEPDSLALFRDKLSRNLTTSVQHNITYQKPVNAYSVFYPISILGNNYGIVFSVNTDTLYESQNRSGFLIFLYTMLLIASIIILFLLIIRRMLMGQKQLKNNDVLLRKANQASEILLTDPDFDRSMQKFFEITAKALGYHRVFILQNVHSGEHRNLTLKHHWADQSVVPSLSIEQFAAFRQVDTGLFDKAISTIESHPLLRLNASEFSEPLRDLVGDLNCQALINLPVIIEDKFYGCVWFMDCLSNRTWQDNEEVYVRNFANAIGGALANQIKKDELIMAKDEAELANQAKSEFLSRMSHELRTPMNAILGFAQLMERGELDAKQQKGVAHIIRSGKHLLAMINDILDISRIEEGRLSISIENIDVNRVMVDVMEIISPLAAKRNITMKIDDGATAAGFVKADYRQLRQVLINLMSNAVKYNLDGGTVEAGAHDRSGDDGVVYTRIYVKDTGAGIPGEYHAKIFMPFSRLWAENTNVEGTGLGLSVVSKLAAAMKGEVGFESEVGKGSTFWIELPKSFDDTINVDFEALDDETIDALHHTKGNLLYVEDLKVNVAVMRGILEAGHSDIRLITTPYGREAVGLAIEYKPNIIILDLNLPDIHGEEVIQLLKANEETMSIPVVVLSADAMDSQIENMMRLGAADYLTKPVNLPKLTKIINAYYI